MAMRHYRLRFRAEGPVHVGNGEKIGKNDYFRLDRETIAVLDARRFVSLLDERQFDDYCEFLEGSARSAISGRTGGRGLQEFLDEDDGVRAKARQSIAYEIRTPLLPKRSGGYQYFDAATCTKDAFGKPYIPGSSVKGVIRTAILNYLVLKDQKRFAKLCGLDSDLAQGKNGMEELSASNRRIDTAAFWDGKHIDEGGDSRGRDLMRYLSVSDSEPLDQECLVFAMKYDLFSKCDRALHKPAIGSRVDRRGNRLNIYRECLKPGTEFTVDIDIDDRIDGLLGFKLDAKGLGMILDVSHSLYEEAFAIHYDLKGIGAGPSNGQEAGGKMADDGKCRYIVQEGPLAGTRCRNRAIKGTGYCNTHRGKAQGMESSGQTSHCFVGGGVGFDDKTVWDALLAANLDRCTCVKARILYSQFPTKLDPRRYSGLGEQIRRAGFAPTPMKAQIQRGGRVKKAKEDHRHWQDLQLGVSPHTLKLGEVGGKRYQMGLCEIRLEQRK